MASRTTLSRPQPPRIETWPLPLELSRSALLGPALELLWKIIDLPPYFWQTLEEQNQLLHQENIRLEQ